jgi:hypothetical protein
MTPEQLADRLGAELTPLPTTPRLSYAELVGRVARRRSRRRRAYAGGAVALLAAAAAVISIVVVSRPAHEAVVRPAAPSVSVSVSQTRPAAAGDVDGDGIPDAVSETGRVLTVVGTRVGRLTLTLPTGLDVVAPARAVNDSGYADVVLTDVPLAGGIDPYYLATVVDPRGAHPSLALVTLAGTPLRLAAGAKDGPGAASATWGCDTSGALVSEVFGNGRVTTRTYQIDGSDARATTTSSSSSTSVTRLADDMCAPTPSAGIDGEQFGDGVVPDGSGTQASYAGKTLLRMAFPGGSVEVPTGWVVIDATLPSDHTDFVIYDPVNPTARFEFSASGCVGCSSRNGDDVTPDPRGPSATTSLVTLPGGRSVAFTEKPWLGYAVNGVDTILQGARTGGVQYVGGYALYRVALPAADHALATTILNSVQLTAS